MVGLTVSLSLLTCDLSQVVLSLFPPFSFCACLLLIQLTTTGGYYTVCAHAVDTFSLVLTLLFCDVELPIRKLWIFPNIHQPCHPPDVCG